VFRGAGGLSHAVQEIGGEKVSVISADGMEFANINVADDDDFERLLQVEAQWIHGAPPCKTFSAARRVDNVASAKRLRSAERPEGFGCEDTEMANKLAMRMLELAKSQVKKGGYFSIENPFSSLIWNLKRYAQFAKEDGIRLVRVHQCMAGSNHKKETGILTNAPWLKDMICDIEVRPHHHVPLMGLVEDFRGDGGKVFYTELAAEYPEGLCNEWATCWMSHLGGDRDCQVVPDIGLEEPCRLPALADAGVKRNDGGMKPESGRDTPTRPVIGRSLVPALADAGVKRNDGGMRPESGRDTPMRPVIGRSLDPALADAGVKPMDGGMRPESAIGPGACSTTKFSVTQH
jgi:hypothetical protein